MQGYVKGKPDRLDRDERETKDYQARPEGMIPTQAAARYAISQRWHYKPFRVIAIDLGMTEAEITALRDSREYIQQVWASYGRSPAIFSKHARKLRCIQHLKHFYGIGTAEAVKVLGNNYKAPEPVQLTLGI